VGLPAGQPVNIEQLPEDCALAAAPRALQTFRWLDCAPEPRSVWASSERPRDPEVLTTPRGFEHMPRMARATRIAREPYRRIILASNGRPVGGYRSLEGKPVQQFSSVSHFRTARGGASMLMDWSQ
jgi:hypothetical protein